MLQNDVKNARCFENMNSEGHASKSSRFKTFDFELEPLASSRSLIQRFVVIGRRTCKFPLFSRFCAIKNVQVNCYR